VFHQSSPFLGLKSGRSEQPLANTQDGTFQRSRRRCECIQCWSRLPKPPTIVLIDFKTTAFIFTFEVQVCTICLENLDDVEYHGYNVSSVVVCMCFMFPVHFLRLVFHICYHGPMLCHRRCSQDISATPVVLVPSFHPFHRRRLCFSAGRVRARVLL
jgi:hypothetical protein